MSHLKLFSPHQLSVFWPEDDSAESPRQTSRDHADTVNSQPVRLRLVWPEKNESFTSENPNSTAADSVRTTTSRTATGRTTARSQGTSRARLAGPHWNRVSTPEMLPVAVVSSRGEQRSLKSAAVASQAETMAWPGDAVASAKTEDRRQKTAGVRGWKSNPMTPLQRARALHANRCCPDCGAAVVIPLSSEHAVTAGDQMPIPGAGELLGFQCGICEHRWSINQHHD